MDGRHSTNSHGEVRSSLRYWIVAGLLLLAGVVGMSILSDRLSPIKPGSERPLHLFVACYALSLAGYVVAYRLLVSDHRQVPIWLIVSVALIARLTFLPSELIQSDDCRTAVRTWRHLDFTGGCGIEARSCNERGSPVIHSCIIRETRGLVVTMANPWREMESSFGPGDASSGVVAS